MGTRKATLEEDQAIIQTLEFLEADIRHRPERLQLLSSAVINHISLLVGHLDVDLNEPLLANDE
ncbi:type II toxin-antitoxin system PrlF family antitoxin [Pseudomonas mandelii]|uniref:type II toxin-antitoxin system PrlF family antitoxin n=1 Tax=Pseudomonas mandelii TaxID=75612 RepID=UPI00137564D7